MNIEYLQNAIKQTHGCESVHLESVPVREVFRDQLVWSGDVDVFSIDHPSGATRCYAWLIPQIEQEPTCITVLGLGPINSPLQAVRAALRTEIRSNQQADQRK